MWADLRSLWEASSAPLTLAVDTPGSIAFDGQSVSLTLGLALDVGSLTIQGQTTGVSLGIPLSAGSLTLAGQSVSFSTGLALNAGSITLDGQSITLALAGNLSLAIDTQGAIGFQGQLVDLALSTQSASGSNPGGGVGGGNSAGWSGKFEFGGKKHDADLIEAQSLSTFHVEPQRVRSPIPENSATILTDAISTRTVHGEDDDEEAITLLLQ